MRKCDSCGKLYQESKDVFCPHCGAVAQKQCTHASSFDSNRYDRGEIYKGNTTQYQNTTYNKGFEPHAQRNETPYNKSQNNSSYGEKIPQINLPDLKKVLSKGNKKGSPAIGIIVFVCVLAVNFILGNIGANQDYSVNEEIVSVQEDYTGEISSLVKNASVEFVEEDGDFKTFRIIIENMYFPFDSADYRTEVRDSIIRDEVYVEMDLCVFSENPVPEWDFDNALMESCLIAANDSQKPGSYELTHDFDYDEIVYINCGVYIYLENGMSVVAELPFGAFSISEDGTVTYYTSYASDETDWATVFEECSNEGSDRGYSGYINFSEE